MLVFGQPRVVLISELVKRFRPVLQPARVSPPPAAKNVNPARNAGPLGRVTARPVGRSTSDANALGKEVTNGSVLVLRMVNPPSAQATLE